MEAFCTANPYPELIIGTGESSSDVKAVKHLSDSEK